MTAGLDGPLAVEELDLAKPQASRPYPRAYPYWLVANFVIYFVALFTVNSGGRLDGNPVSNANFLSPAGYAFAIWAVIFLYLMITASWTILQWPCFSCVPTERIQTMLELSPWFCLGQMFMIGWCFTYTERFLSIPLLWISAVCLSGIAVSLSFAHRAVAASDGLQELVFLYPGITMQFGWCTAAALLNWNTWLVLVTSSPGVKLVVLILCIAAAGVIGYLVGAYRNSLLYTGTICWALVAIGVNTLGAPAPMVAGLGRPLTLFMGVVEIGVGAGIVGAVLYAKVKHCQESPKVEESS